MASLRYIKEEDVGTRLTLEQRKEIYTMLDEGIAKEDIPDIIDVSASALKKIIKERTEVDSTTVIDLFGDKFTPNEIAETLGVSLSHIKTILIQKGLLEQTKKGKSKKISLGEMSELTLTVFDLKDIVMKPTSDGGIQVKIVAKTIQS